MKMWGRHDWSAEEELTVIRTLSHGGEVNGCVVLHDGECGDLSPDSPGIWTEARAIHAQAPERNPQTGDRAYADAHGVVDLYAARMQRMSRGWREVDPIVEAMTPPEELKVAALGRRTETHYRAVRRARRGQMREMQGVMEPMGMDMPTNERERRGLMQVAAMRLHLPRWTAPRRAIVATVAAAVLTIGAVSSGFAQQYRYVVQDGDTVQSVADTFGVDADAIAASSYMPNGDTLEAGQVIIIPEVGQSPSDAAQQAAELEGTSPWAASAYWVQDGDTLDSIAAAYNLDAQALADFNGITDPTLIVVGQRLVIPTSRDGEDTHATTETSDSSVILSTVPTYVQSRNLSCEYASVHIATAAFGNAIPEDVMISSIPVTLNPHNGYRGNIDGPWGNTDDYGIYPEALVPTLNDYGFVGETFYSYGDASQLTAQIDAGHPTLVWLGLWGDTRVRLDDDGSYSVASGMHVMVAYGYDDDGVYVSDPAHGTYGFYTWDEFTGMWSVLDGMALAVYPQS